MVEFPPQTLVSVPFDLLPPGDSRIEVRLRSVDDFSKALGKYGTRLRSVQLPGRELAGLEESACMSSPQNVSIRIRVGGLEELLEVDLRRRVPAGRTVFLVEVGPEFPRVLNHLADLNARIHILPRARRSDAAPEEPADEELLDRALETFLRHPTLRTPVEPLAAVLHTTIEGKGPSLWDTEREKAGGTFYMSETGEVSLSARCHDYGTNFGTMEDTYEALTESAAYRRFTSLRTAIFSEKLACVFCPHLRPCGGFFKALDAEADCSAWQHAFARLAEETQNARELVRHYSGTEGGGRKGRTGGMHGG